jgi:hypothetical protein
MAWYYICESCKKIRCIKHTKPIYNIKEETNVVFCLKCFNKVTCSKCNKLFIEIIQKTAYYNNKGEYLCEHCENKRYHKAVSIINKNITSHSNIQKKIGKFLNKTFNMGITYERSLSEYGLVDIIAINNKNNEIYGFEIKSGKITNKIKQQLNKYYKFFDLFFVIIKESELDKLLSLIDDRFGIFIINKTNNKLFFYRRSRRKKDFSKNEILQKIKSYALRWIAITIGINILPSKLRNMGKSEIIPLIDKVVNIKEIRQIYADYISKKYYVNFFTLTNKRYKELYIPKIKEKIKKVSKILYKKNKIDHFL